MVIYSIVVTPAGFDASLFPPPIKPLVLFDTPAHCSVDEDKFPKSNEFPVAEMVM